jgi:hypothetical protein
MRKALGLGKVFSEYFGFPCKSSFHHLLHNNIHLSSGAGTISQKRPRYQLDSVSPHERKKRRGKKNSEGHKMTRLYKNIEMSTVDKHHKEYKLFLNLECRFSAW